MHTLQSVPPFISRLQKKFNDPLPGESSHQQMAHAVRRAQVTPDAATQKDAAVLITLFEKAPDDWHVIFIRRVTKQGRDKHSGQIAFPGGRKDATDPDLMYTSLREAEEEIALDLTAIYVLGKLTPLYITVSQFMVHPYVAYLSKKPVLRRQETEIEEILELPLAAFYEPDVRQSTRIKLDSRIVLNHVPSFQVQGHVIWGATAMILSELLEIIQPRQ